jgi:segregation and condensation protein B
MTDPIGQGTLAALEVILFSTEEPISAYQIAQMLQEEGHGPREGNLTPARVDRLVEQLVREWEMATRPLTVLKIAGGYQMATRPEWSELVARLQEDKRSHRLSRASLETLAIVAYKQPVIRPDIDAIRGVNSDSALKTLMERGLVTISGRDEGPGRPLLYRTTNGFLKYFGLNSLSDLPEPRELTAILGPRAPEPAEGAPQAALELVEIDQAEPEPIVVESSEPDPEAVSPPDEADSESVGP